MSLTKNQVASVAYTLENGEGDVLDQASKDSPMTFLHGVGGMIPGFEKALEGKDIGDSFSIVIEAEDAYGERDDTLTQDVARSMFGDVSDDQLGKGAQFQMQTDRGVEVITVISADADIVKVDANHPLAGMTLHFDVEMLDIRDATEEELEHGHVHAEGGCGH
ncbi:MAG TPA: peptidylprolyl isomerase [Leucothrix mucor]|nr:peptidylprolyl isomerase [Leucothrix mucor]